jgi:hypothetical protein
MHKGVILLVKTADREDAIDQVESFLEPYGDGDVWDWYEVGGRWTGTLTGYDPAKDERNIETCDLCNGTGDRKDLDPPEWKKQCNGCNGCDGTGKKVKWSLVKVDDDVMPLTDERVEKKVREWADGWEKKCLERIEESESHFKDDKHMLGYLMKKRGSIIGDEFSFDSNVYDVHEGTNSLPKSFDGYWAAVVDMHN